MPAYNTSTGGTVGALLRKIEEEKTQNPALVPPGTQAGEAQRGTVQTPVLKADSPGSALVLNAPAEGVSGGIEAKNDSITPRPSITGVPYGQRGGEAPGSFNPFFRNEGGTPSFNIPQQKVGNLPKATPITAVPPVSLAAPTGPKSYVQTPGTKVGTTITSGAVPFSYQAGRSGAESIVSAADKELQGINQAIQQNGFDSEAGQAALDKLQKLDAQLQPLAANAPVYLKQNLATLSEQVSGLRQEAVKDFATNYRQIPEWANPTEQALGQSIISQIQEAEQARAAWEAAQSQGDGGGGDNGGGGGQSSGGQSQPQGQPQGQPQQARSTGQVSRPQVLGTQVIPSYARPAPTYSSRFIGPVQVNRGPDTSILNKPVNLPAPRDYNKADLTKMVEQARKNNYGKK